MLRIVTKNKLIKLKRAEKTLNAVNNLNLKIFIRNKPFKDAAGTYHQPEIEFSERLHINLLEKANDLSLLDLNTEKLDIDFDVRAELRI